MPIIQKLVEFSDLFYKLPEDPVIINDLVDNTEEDKENIKNIITTRYSGDMISLIPSCRCGSTKGMFSVATKCQECGTIVKSVIDDTILPNVWFRSPKGVEKLINPIIWIMLRRRFNRSGFSVVQWIADTSYRPNIKQPPVISKIIESGIQRGYNNFVRNFDYIMEYLFNLKEFRLKRGQIDYLEILIKENRNSIFSDYIPLPNKSLLIIEKTNVGVYVDPIIIDAVDAIQMLVSIDVSFHDQNPRVKENRTIRALSKLTDFYEKFFKLNLAPKAGQFRKHIYGSRTNFSFRAVITSLTDTHEYDEIHVPWSIGLTAFRPHLINKLMNIGMDLNSAIGLILGHVERHHPLLERLLEELIQESRTGIYVLAHRNPSLLQGSIQRLRITKFKAGPKTKDEKIDRTISLSILICKAYNADFDGDAINVSIALDNKMADFWYCFEPKFNILQLDKPDKISDNISLPKPNVCCHSKFILD